MNNKSIIRDIDYDMIRKAQETLSEEHDQAGWHLLSPTEATTALDLWVRAAMRGGVGDTDFTFQTGGQVRRIKGYRVYNLRPKYPPSLRLIYVPLISKFVGSNLTAPIDEADRLEAYPVLTAFDEVEDGDDEAARRCITANFCYRMDTTPIHMRNGDWIVVSLSKVRPDVHFTQWVRSESGIRNPLLGLVKMLKTLCPKALDNMIRFTYDFGTPKSLLGEAITHLDKFRTLP